MGFTKALFYPTIDISNENWLKNAILFWDEINTIVPSSIVEPYQKNTTQYLSSEGILKPLRVHPDNALVEQLTPEVLKYMNTNEGVQLLSQGQDGNLSTDRNKVHRSINYFYDIYPEKLPHEIQRQLRHNLTDEGWLRVDNNFAFFYMTLLANKICEQKSIALLTDNLTTSNLSDLARLDSQPTRNRRYDIYDAMTDENPLHLAQGILTNLVIQGIKISSTSSLEDIVKFKRKHQDELGNFRTNITKLAQGVKEDTSFEAMQQQVKDIYNDEFLPAYNDFKKSLGSAGIKWVADNFIKVSFFSTSATAIPTTLLGLALPQALLAGVGISIISSLISYNIEKRDKLRKNPYSYLLAVDKEL